MLSSYMHELKKRGLAPDRTEGKEVALRSELTTRTRSREVERVEEEWNSELTLLYIVARACAFLPPSSRAPLSVFFRVYPPFM